MAARPIRFEAAPTIVIAFAAAFRRCDRCASARRDRSAAAARQQPIAHRRGSRRRHPRRSRSVVLQSATWRPSGPHCGPRRSRTAGDRWAALQRLADAYESKHGADWHFVVDGGFRHEAELAVGFEVARPVGSASGRASPARPVGALATTSPRVDAARPPAHLGAGSSTTLLDAQNLGSGTGRAQMQRDGTDRAHRYPEGPHLRRSVTAASTAASACTNASGCSRCGAWAASSTTCNGQPNIPAARLAIRSGTMRS